MSRKNKMTVEEFVEEMNELTTGARIAVEKTKQEVLKKVGHSLVSDQVAKAFQYSGDLYNESIRLKLALSEVEDAYLRVRIDKNEIEVQKEIEHVKKKTIWELDKLLKKVTNMKKIIKFNRTELWI